MTGIGAAEKAAVMRVLDSGVLSGFLAGQLHGGPEVQALEAEWAAYFGFKHAVAMNSATSCLIAACGAVGLNSGDKVIVPPLTMSASATCMLPWGSVPYFQDIEPDYFCLNPTGLEFFGPDWRDNSNGTKAIITVDIFGQSSNPELLKLKDILGSMPIIQDASQRPVPGGFGDIVVHSLNYHKHIHCGEGGMACTNNDFYADKLRLIRNHAECGKGTLGAYWRDLYGFNFRMTEIEAAIAREQLKKLPAEITRRQELAEKQSNLAPVRPGFEHAWYLFPHLTHTAPDDGIRYADPLYNLHLFRDDAKRFPNTEKVWNSLWMTRP